MSNPTNTPRQPLPPTQTPSLITSSPHALQKFELTAPILRLDFPTPAAQATFHRAFLQVRNEKDKAAFMQRFFDNYDGQVSIPRRVIMDTSQDEEVARRLQGSLPVEVDAGRDEEMARRLQGQMEQMERGGFGGAGRGSLNGGHGRMNGRNDSTNGRGYDVGSRGVAVDDEDEAYHAGRRIERQREMLEWTTAADEAYIDTMERLRHQFSRAGLQDLGAYPGQPGYGNAPSQRHPRLPPRRSENQVNEFDGYHGNLGHGSSGYGQGNGGYSYGYNPRRDHWGHRGGGY
ncbi:hypothetical protein BKA58DRAFT_433457 [Alternaria rosae]|uniref:uncharacterized protein n=1 Tax=Alternaria rosae TaxID=1187941 RepID=UPI001E8EF1BB|nr:uncharacterized protein BKA58DRAFT_433457 [Alternaria rosae]KAH6881677.1 hypothetical protein BKA58DRAFT_433457 [Alternaria rosae]